MSNEIAVALLAGVGIVMSAALAAISAILSRRAEHKTEPGNGHRLTEAYSKLLDEQREELDRLHIQVDNLERALAATVGLRERVRELEHQNRALLTQVAEQQHEIERLRALVEPDA